MIIWLRNVVKIIFFISFYLSTYGHSAEKQDIANLLKHQKSISSINIDHFDDIEQLHVPLNDYESYCSNKKIVLFVNN